MVELTEREQKIIHYIMTMNNPQTNDQPLDIRILALKSVMLCADLDFDYNEMKDLSEAIKAENERAMLSGMGKLDKYKHLLKDIKSF